jgi:2-hydroxy-3-keto-5-methylthiopentenyl-1-phosphate phosphatase
MRPPPAAQAQVWIDFDGTITERDLLDELILKYAIDDSWRRIEELWLAGEIGSRQCLQDQLALVRIGNQDLENFLDGVTVDPGLIPLLDLLGRFDVPSAVLSDGIDFFIERTLGRHNVKLPVRCNAIERRGLELNLQCPLSREDCESKAAHCKCGSMAELGSVRRASIYIGDGRSDLCPARKVEFVFAKGALAEALAKEGRPFTRFETLLDVKGALERCW